MGDLVSRMGDPVSRKRGPIFFVRDCYFANKESGPVYRMGDPVFKMWVLGSRKGELVSFMRDLVLEKTYFYKAGSLFQGLPSVKLSPTFGKPGLPFGKQGPPFGKPIITTLLTWSVL